MVVVRSLFLISSLKKRKYCKVTRVECRAKILPIVTVAAFCPCVPIGEALLAITSSSGKLPVHVHALLAGGKENGGHCAARKNGDYSFRPNENKMHALSKKNNLKNGNYTAFRKILALPLAISKATAFLNKKNAANQWQMIEPLHIVGEQAHVLGLS